MAKGEGRQRRLLNLPFGLDVFQDFPFDFDEFRLRKLGVSFRELVHITERRPP